MIQYNRTAIATTASTATQRILVVEDNRDVLCALSELLTLLDWRYCAAKSGEAALEFLIADRDFSILLSDIALPGISGIELAKKAHGMVPQLQIIFMSGYNNLPAGVVNFPFLSLPKPYTLTQLQEVLEKARNR